MSQAADGRAGDQGVKGEKGEPGAEGYQRPVGPEGDQGPVGPKGDQGPGWPAGRARRKQRRRRRLPVRTGGSPDFLPSLPRCAGVGDGEKRPNCERRLICIPGRFRRCHGPRLGHLLRDRRDSHRGARRRGRQPDCRIESTATLHLASRYLGSIGYVFDRPLRSQQRRQQLGRARWRSD